MPFGPLKNILCYSDMWSLIDVEYFENFDGQRKVQRPTHVKLQYLRTLFFTVCLQKNWNRVESRRSKKKKPKNTEKIKTNAF